MKKLICTAVAALGVSFAVITPASAQVGVSVSIGDPNFYGSLILGNGMQPLVINRQPIIVPGYGVPMQVAPIYLRVPAYQRQHWRRYCNMYSACGYPVYFVQDNWYSNVYAPYYRGRPDYHGHYRDHGRPDYRGGPGRVDNRGGDYRGNNRPVDPRVVQAQPQPHPVVQQQPPVHAHPAPTVDPRSTGDYRGGEQRGDYRGGDRR